MGERYADLAYMYSNCANLWFLDFFKQLWDDFFFVCQTSPKQSEIVGRSSRHNQWIKLTFF